MFERLSVPKVRTLPRPVPGGGNATAAVRGVAVVCAAFVVVQLLVAVPGTGLGWDETVYVSQVSGHVPAAFFSAPRARGISVLAAPVAELTSSTAVLRVYMALLSGAGLFLALRVWRFLLPARVLTAAGALFASLWITVLYGPQVMPNLWSAFGALAAVGCFARAVRDPSDRAAPAGLAAAVTVVGLMRPPDAVWLVLPLAGAALAVARLRRPVVLAALAAGLLLGCAEWVVEAYVHYGGLAARLDRAGEIQGGIGWNLAVDDQIRALDGRSLCRPCNVPWRHPMTSAWWFALPVLAVAGAVVAPAGRRNTVRLALLAAACLAFPYLFTIGYAAPRFLLPAYALAAIPVAECLWRLVAGAPGAVRSGGRRFRPAATALVAGALCVHLGIQGGVLVAAAGNSHRAREKYEAVADRLHSYGVRPPCLVSGDSAVPIAFYTGCASRQIGGPDASITAAGILASSLDRPVAVVVADGRRPPVYARNWRPAPLPPPPGATGFRAYLPPSAPAAAP